MPSAVSASAAQVDQVATSVEPTTTPEATSPKTESQPAASSPGECISELGGQLHDLRVSTASAAVPAPSAERPTRSPGDSEDVDPTGRVSGGTASPETLVEATDGTTGAKGPYGSLTRDDLEYLLSEADRVIREKEQELATFTAAGQGLLDEYNRLRQEHDTLAPSSSRSAPPSAQSSPTQFRQRGTTPRIDQMDADRVDGLTSLNSTALDQGRQVSLDYSPERSRKESGIRATTWLTPRSATGHGASPTSLRSQDKSGIISTISRSGSSRILFSPAAQAKETAVLSQANYTLTLQLSEVQAESEAAEREGRKRLRKLERELQSLRADLERVEQRNAILEAQTELAKTKRTGSVKASRACRAPSGRALHSPMTPEKSRVQRTPSMRHSGGGYGGYGGSPFEPRIEEASSAPRITPRTDQQEVDRPRFLFPHPAPTAPSDDRASNTSPALLQRPVYRTVSSSSLVPLPPPVHLDPSLEKQQDELVDQLMAKIDELQDTNHVFLTEREHMFHRLNEAQEEVYEWKERCEELEDENQQHRLIGWRNDVENTGHAWLDSDDAEGAVIAYEPERLAAEGGRSVRSSADHNHVDALPQTSYSASDGTPNEFCAPQQPEWPTPAPRSLQDELESMCLPPAHFDELAAKPTTTSSLVVRKPSEDFDRGREWQDRLDWPCSSKAAQTTRDDLLPSGSLRYSGYPSAEKYEVLERAVTALEPTWADAHLPAAHQSRMTLLQEAKLRIGGASDRVEEFTGSDRARKSVLRISDDDPELAPSGSASAGGPCPSSLTVATTSLRRRRRALRRLDHEASLRKSGQELILHRDTAAHSDSASNCSSTLTDFDMLEHSLRRRSDYQPTDRLSRLRPSALVGRAVDSAGHHVLTLFTWLRFMILLSTAVVFAIWQGPQKTLGTAAGRPRQLQ